MKRGWEIELMANGSGGDGWGGGLVYLVVKETLKAGMKGNIYKAHEIKKERQREG